MSPSKHQGSISGPVFYQDGAGYAGKGRFFLPILGTDKTPKEITVRVVVIAIVAVLVVFFVASLLAGKEPAEFPYELELLNSIGQPLETAAMKTGVSLADMEETEPGVYFTNSGFPIDGVAFDLYFYEEDGCLSGFAYIAEYQADTKEAAKDIRNALLNLDIETFVPTGETQPVSVNRRNLQRELDKETTFLVKRTSDITPVDSRDPMKAYLDALEAAEDWEGRLGEYVVRKAVFYIDRGASYDPETQKVQLVLSYRIEPQREEIYYD